MPWVLVLVAVVFVFAGVAATVSATGKVRHLERTLGLDVRLTDALALYAQSGGIPIVVTSGIRTDVQQLALWNKGRTTADAVVTYARTAAETAHGARANGGNAFDFAVLVDGLPAYGDLYIPLYQPVNAFFKQLGLVTGADRTAKFPPYGDYNHVETPDWKSQYLLPEANV